MFRFFRNIRRRLLESGKTRRYLTYAIGEIILVVIGILIALQINTWNDDKKNRQDFELLFDNIEADLISKIEESYSVVEGFYNRDSLLQLVRNETVTEEMYQRSPELRLLITRWDSYDFMMDNLQRLIEKEDYTPAKYQAILPLVKEYKSNVEIYQKLETNWVQSIFDTRSYFSANFPWFRRTDSLSIQQSIQYFTSDPLYYTRAMEYDWQIRYVGKHAMHCRNLAIGLLAKIQLLRKKISPADLSNFFQQHGLQPFERLDCQETRNRNEPRSHSYGRYLFFNALAKQVELSLIREGEKTFSFSLPPGGYYSNGPITSDQEGDIQLNNQEECQRRFRSVKNGFLLIE